MLIERLHYDINKVCPITGVSVPDSNNKNTWGYIAASGATTAQKTAASGVIANFNMAVSYDILYLKEMTRNNALKLLISNDPYAVFIRGCLSGINSRLNGLEVKNSLPRINYKTLITSVSGIIRSSGVD